MAKATDVCSTVENEKESYNKLHQVKGLVPVCTHLCMLQYSANMDTLGYYMFLLSCKGHGHVQHCQECKGELQ
jgi:hypothetical protein